jgi:hypothetical protein
MNVDELLREAAPDQVRLRNHTAAVRAGVLARATTVRPPRARRPVRAACAALALAVVGVGGAAYAAGGAPALFTSIVDDFGADNQVPASERPLLRQFVDLTLPDGSRFAAWRGESDAMWCDGYVDNWDGVQPSGSGGGACGDSSSARLNDNTIAWARSRDRSTYYAVLFGVARPGEVEVRVSGTFAGTREPTGLTVSVDPTTSGYAAALPGSSAHPWAHLRDFDGFRESGLTLRFVDASGRVQRTTQAPAG